MLLADALVTATASQLTDAINLSNKHKLIAFFFSQLGWIVLQLFGLWFAMSTTVDYWFWMWLTAVTLSSTFLQVGAILGFASLDKVISIVRLVSDAKESEETGTRHKVHPDAQTEDAPEP